MAIKKNSGGWEFDYYYVFLESGQETDGQHDVCVVALVWFAACLPCQEEMTSHFDARDWESFFFFFIVRRMGKNIA